MGKEGKPKKIRVVNNKEDSRVLVAKLNEKVAELEKSEEELRYLSSVLGAIRNINQLIVGERDKAKLLKDACRILLKVREYRFVWIGLIEEGHKRVIPVARAGVEGGYLDSVEITWDDRQSGRGPTGTAIKTRQPDMIKNIPENPRAIPWREEALKRGYRSSAAIPLIHGDKIYGALNVYSSQPEGFNDAEVELLVEVSGDLGFALKAIERQEARQRAEEKLQTILKTALDGFWLTNLEGKILEVNDSYCKMVGYTREELLKMSISDLEAIESPEEVAQHVKRIIEQGYGSFESRHKRKDGKIISVEISVNYLDVGEGQLFVFARDITERKQAENILRMSERDLAEAQELAHVGNWRWEIIPDEVYWSDEAYRLFGVEPGEAVDYAKYLSIVLPEDRDFIMKEVQDALDGTKPYENEHRIVRNGEIRIHHTKGTVTQDEQGKPIRLFGVVQDITERKQAEDALRESEARYRAVIEGAHDMIQSVGFDGSIIFVNKSWLDTLGYAEAELSSLNLFEIVHPDSRAHYREMFAEVAKGKSLHGVEAAFLTKDGRKILVEGNAAPRYIGSKVVATQGIFRDVTERKRAEAALADEATRHRILIDESSDGIVILDENGKVYEANRRFAEMLAYSPEEVRKLNVWDWEFQYPREQVAEMIRTVDETGDHFETKHRRKDGTTFDVEISTNGAVYAGQKLIFCVCRDITARKQAEAALRESEEKYKNLVGATSDIIWETDAEGRFTFISPKIKDILGYSVNEVVGKKRTLDLIAEREKRKWLKRFKELNARRKPFFGLEITHVHKNGRQVIFETSGIPLFDSAGEFKGFVGIDKDITERRQMQEQLVITDRLASVGELAAGIAHELNNPLTGVIGFSQLLMDREMPDDAREDLQAVYSEAQRASQVVKNLLTFARKHTAAKEKVNINDVINKVLELRTYELNLENIKVDARLDSELPKVMADYFQLQQVFLNIIINAEYFMKEAHNKGTLTITTEKVGTKVKVSFADDGPGIDKDDLGHLFDPFFTTKEVGKGTGLGLSICHGIIAEHGGRIYAESELGKGATFIVELPIGAAEDKGGAA